MMLLINKNLTTMGFMARVWKTSVIFAITEDPLLEKNNRKMIHRVGNMQYITLGSSYSRLNSNVYLKDMS